MSFTLTTDFDDCFEFKGKTFNVDMSFDNILLLFEMFDDKDLYEHEKVFYALQMLIEEFDELQLSSPNEAYELFKYLLKEFLDIDLDKKNDEGQSNVKMYDFTKDATLIYASFFAVYKVDLFELKGKLHWNKFEALLHHLDDNSPFKKVIGYRTMKVPNGQHVDKDYRNHIIKMKQLYSLDDNATGKDSSYRSFEQLFNASNGK